MDMGWVGWGLVWVMFLMADALSEVLDLGFDSALVGCEPNARQKG
jgi:hypothetical protein